MVLELWLFNTNDAGNSDFDLQRSDNQLNLQYRKNGGWNTYPQFLAHKNPKKYSQKRGETYRNVKPNLHHVVSDEYRKTK